MSEKIPEMMRAVIQEGPGVPLKVVKLPVPVPTYGEVLVRVAASPINPSDLSMLNGTYAIKPQYPVVPGIEGSGLVIASGGGLLAGMRTGKRVSCSSSAGRGGTWSEFIVTSALRTIPIGKNSGYQQGSMLIVNPLTALAFLHIARKGKHKAVVNNAAASSLGKMMIRIFGKYNIPIINIVRTHDQAVQLKEMGASHVINSSDDDFKSILSDYTNKLGADLIFDAVGGDQTALLIETAPRKSRIILYANLSETAVTVDPRIIIQNDKKIEGFFLGNWNSNRSLLSKLSDTMMAKKLISNHLNSTISKTYSLDNVNSAVTNYRDNMSAGKVLIIPNQELFK